MNLRHWQASVCVAVMLMSTAQQGMAQQIVLATPQGSPTTPQVQNDTTGTPGLPQAPEPKRT